MVKSPTLGKQTPKFVISLIIIKVNIECLERVIVKFLRNYFTLTIVSMATAALKIMGFCNFSRKICATEAKRNTLER